MARIELRGERYVVRVRTGCGLMLRRAFARRIDARAFAREPDGLTAEEVVEMSAPRRVPIAESRGAAPTEPPVPTRVRRGREPRPEIRAADARSILFVPPSGFED